MTSVSNPFGRPTTYPFAAMDVGETVKLDVPTAADVKRITRNASQYGIRRGQGYRCKTDRVARVMTVTRVR